MADAILTDIEGTTSSLSFVKDVLFPYAAEHLPAFVRAHAEEPEVQAQLDAVRAETGAADTEAVIQSLLDWIAQDRKATPLKALQGLIWEAGYKDGGYQGHIYPDAIKYLRAWHAAGKKLYVFSSGSVKAQKLLFGHTEAGDLTPLFSAYFDTTSGMKQTVEAYQNIAADIGLAAGRILFLSDTVAELDAAQAAGMQTCCLVREGELHTDCAHPQARDFAAVEVNA
jgi:enolase-phosphatase E1